jgi:hypothetical protein
MQPIRLPTIPELVARAMTGTRFLAEIAARSPHDLRCCAELAAQLAAEQWETETGAPAAETVPHDLTIQVAASLIAHGERHHGPVENALYANEGQLQRSIAALGALQAGIRDTPPLAAAEEALMDVAADRLDEAGAALRGVLALLEAEIDRVERAKASRPRPGAKAIAQIHVASGIRFQTLAAVESTDGMTLLSTFGAADGSGDTELHIPAAARAWLAGVMGRPANSERKAVP